MIRAAYKNGGYLKYAMSVPEVIETLSNYMFTSSARIATMRTNVDQGNTRTSKDGDGTQSGGVTAQGAVNMYVTNFGAVTFVPNLFQPDSGTGAADLFLIDPNLWSLCFLQGYRIKKLGDTGLSAKRLLSVDYALLGLAERGNAVVADIDYALAMTL
jgi:hypothetical protein